ncbi:MAG: hypothetical protein K9G46_08060 [Flavobacteriales bacterium]|nr:hypothetical protein [Flavobacteriales bacterium]
MRKLLLIAFLLQSALTFAQPYGNEWVDASQPHFQFNIHKEGIYRISYQVLDNALAQQGFNLNSIDPRNIQLFARGEQQFIYLGGEADGVFDPNDFIEFYARGNDGVFDDGVYFDNPLNNANPYYSLINDTIRYFLTWNNSTNNARMAWETDVNFSAFTASTYIIRDEIKELHNNYFYGQTFNQTNSTSPIYDGGEGFYGYYFDPGFIDSFWNLSTAYRYSQGPDAEVEISVVGNSYDNKNLHIQGPSINFDAVIDQRNGYRYNFTIPTASLDANTSNFTFTINNPVTPGGYQAIVGYVKVRYPQTPNISNGTAAKFLVGNNPNYPGQNKSRVQLAGYAQSTPRLYDLTNHRILPVGGAPGSYEFLVPDNGSLKECYITSEASISANAITILKPAGPNGSVYFTDFNALDPSTDYFAIGPSSFYNVVQQYASYRNSSGHNAIGIDVEELYNQFGWGINKHPLAIRKFAAWALGKLTAPKHIFLIGKTVRSHSGRTDPALFSQILVPTFGYPPSDNMITSYLGTGTYLEETGIPIGRLAAQTPQQVTEYMQKVQEYEALGNEFWMKRGIHLSGGTAGPQLLQIRAFMDSYKYIFEDTLLGGNIQTFQKTSSQLFQSTQVDSIRNLVNNGVQFINFIGHGSSVGFDVSIDYPSLFNNNNGKYPVMMANSCYAGDIHQPLGVPSSISEQWVLEPQRGAMAFLSTVGPGNLFYLNSYCTNFYHSLSHFEYNNTIGWQIKRAIRENAQPFNYVTRLHNLEYTLHGDPGINITKRPDPDLMVNQQSIWFEPQEITTEMATFEMNIKITNLGAAFTDSFFVQIARQLPTGQIDTTLTIIHPPVYYLDTLTVFVPVNLVDGLGINKLCVSLNDPVNNNVGEVNFSNNFTCVDVNVLSPDLVPIWPYKFAVIPDQGPTLKCSTGNPFAPVKTYRIELDTTDLFNSPLKQFTTITQGGGVVNWTPSLLANMPDSTVYFWRASVDSATYGFYKWRETSFQYIIDKYGWGQAHYFQYKEDDHLNIIYNRPERDWDFYQTVKQFKLNNFGNPTTLAQAEDFNYFVDNGREEYIACPGPSVQSSQFAVIVLDACSLEPWRTPGIDQVTGQSLPGNGNHGQLTNCNPNRPRGWYTFRVNGDLPAFENFVNNVIPDSSYIGIMSWLNIDFENLPLQYRQVFTNLGATSIDTLSGVPYNFFVKKGNPSTAIETFGTSLTDHVSLTTVVTGCYNQGTITTKYIGPTSQWKSLHVRADALENPTQDSIAINVIGVRPSGVEEVVMSGINGTSTDILDLYNSIDASVYPRLRLSAFCADDSSASTPPQMDRWQVLFEGVPEAALNPHISYSFESDTLYDGDLLKFHVAIENISEFDMDSLLVHYWIEDAGGNRAYLPYPRQAPLLAGAFLYDTITTSPLAFLGGNVFWVEVNPRRPDQSFGYDQLEQYHFNNLANVKFSVAGDGVNPIMDVTFDGIHILDGDIVSAKPYIVIELDDESQYRLLNDTSDYQVFLKEPETENLKRVWFKNFTNMQFYPGETPDNKARIEWDAEFQIDGIYELWVQGYDQSNNAAGDQYYRISFEVINEATISNVLNYPNPFSTATHFVFTITGSEQPDYFKIQVMTITGKVVREITMDDLGQMNIGRNVTQYAWDGKDTYGDQLANGVYLYRMVAKLQGDYIKHRDSGADKWIESGFGKMMLIR